MKRPVISLTSDFGVQSQGVGNIVDPGVGSSRRAIIIKVQRGNFGFW